MTSNQKCSRAVAAILAAHAGTALAAAPADEAAVAAGGVTEVVVTAQRRSENIQDVPIAIQALTGEALGQLNVTNFDDFVKYLPNVTSSSAGPGQSQIFMRGLSVGDEGTQSGGSINGFPNVAIYLDDQSGQLPGRNLDVYAADLERVEVLEGPQGTLFGAGAQAGVIRYITNKPKLNVTEGSLTGGFGTTAGAVGTRKALTDIAERLGAPVLCTNAGKGILPESHPLSLGCSILQAASQQALAEADVVLLVGSEVGSGDHFNLTRLEISGDIIRIDIDPGELTSVYSAAVPIQSDARAALLALSDALSRRTPAAQRSEGERRARDILERNASTMSDLEKLHTRVWRILRSALPADTIIMGDASQIVYTGSFAMPMEVERCWYYSGTYCALGFALPMAVGAKIGAPHRPVIAIAGDGGFMFTANELATAAEERLALPVIVWNNDALKEIVAQMDKRDVPRIGVEPKSPDFLRLAESLGCHATRAGSAEHLARAVREALVADRPTLIEVREDSGWLAAGAA